jgi:ribosomal protein S18 acetylase RimI-like enzyme
VRADNDAARGLYTSLGFQEIDRRTGYYQPDGVDAIVMTLAIAAAEPGWAVAND